MIGKFEVGQILQGKVTGIQPYGAFVALNDNVQGLVHISEVTHGFVNDINDYLSVGNDVTVKILNIDESTNKISLSIKATEEVPQKEEKPVKKAGQPEESDHGFNTLKDKLEMWAAQSKDRQSMLKK